MGVVCNRGTRNGAGLLRTVCLFANSGSFEKTGSTSLVSFNDRFTELDVSFRDSKERRGTTLFVSNGERTDLGKVGGGSPTTLNRRVGTIVFSPIRLSVVGSKPTRQEGFVSNTLYRVGSGCFAILGGCGEDLRREGTILGSVDAYTSLHSVLCV